MAQGSATNGHLCHDGDRTNVLSEASRRFMIQVKDKSRKSACFSQNSKLFLHSTADRKYVAVLGIALLLLQV